MEYQVVYKAKDVFNIMPNEISSLKNGGNFTHDIDLNYPMTFSDNLKGNYELHKIPEFDANRMKKEIIVTDYQKMPYKGNQYDENHNKKYPNFNDNELIKIIRDKVDLERFYEKVNHFNPGYIQAVQNVGEKILSEIFDDVYTEFDTMVNGFVSGVIKSEFE